jgi:nitroimidazol reductase NimA-like FMN-containing flavoprotein (pyridoxamine 5'-phosphate oxidase superfamily)
MATMTKQAREEFLADVHIGVLSIGGAAGRPPLSSPVFYHYEPGGNISFFTNTQHRVSQKRIRIEETGTATLVAQREEMPYAYVTVEGTVVAVDAPPTEEQLFAIASRYMPEEIARGFIRSELDDPESTLTVVTIRPDRWFTSDKSKD